PKVTDFGLAKRLETEIELTLSGQLLGSPNYMPPEQAAAKRGAVGKRSDVYALGAILYHLLTGRPPFVAPTVAETLQEVLNTEPVSPRVLNPGVPHDLETICAKCLEKDAAKRYQTAAALAEELDRFLNDEPIQARPIGVGGKVWRWCRRKPLLAGLAASLIFVFALGFTGTLTQWRKAVRNAQNEARQRNRADQEQRRVAEAARQLAQNLYVADMNVAQRALEDANLKRATELIGKYLPRSDAREGGAFSTLNGRLPATREDLRGFEWRYLWQQCQGDEITVIPVHTRGLMCVDFSPDGTWLATAGEDKMVKVWDLSTRGLFKALEPFQATISWYALAFSAPEGKFLAASDGRTVRVWETTTWEKRASMDGSFPLAFSPDAKTLAFRNTNGITLWDSEARQANGTLTEDFEPGDGPFAFSPDNRFLAAASKRKVLLYDAQSKAMIRSFPEEALRSNSDSEPNSLGFFPDGRFLAAGYWDGTLKIWELESGRSATEVQAHECCLRGLSISPDGTQLASTGDQMVKIWRISRIQNAAPALELLAAFKGHLGVVYDVKFSPDGQTLATASYDGTARLWPVLPKPEGGDELPEACLPIWFAPDGRTLATLNNDRTVQFWDVTTLRPASSPLEITRQADLAGAAAISSDGKTLAVGLKNGVVELWDLTTRHRMKVLKGDGSAVLHLSFSPDNRRLAVACYREVVGHSESSIGSLRVWNLTTEQVDTFSNEASRYAAFSPDGSLLAAALPESRIGLWDTSSGEVVASPAGMRHGQDTLAFSPDGRSLAGEGSAAAPWIWSLDTTNVLTFSGLHKRGIWSMAFSPDRKTLATGSSDQTVRLWNLATGQEILAIKGFKTDVASLLFSPDGTLLAAGGTPGHGPVHLLRAPSFDEIHAKEKDRTQRMQNWKPARE
ncbi:MAG: protein kinase, partial [Verrucomicrobia bacterium]|nr:protein kinase [Verrucomicrobiota bacterium]